MAITIEKKFKFREIELLKSEPNGRYWIIIQYPIPNEPMSTIKKDVYKTEKNARKRFEWLTR